MQSVVVDVEDCAGGNGIIMIVPSIFLFTADTCQCLTGNFTDDLNTVILCQPLRRGNHLRDRSGGFALSVKRGDVICQ